ncbi:hypothetical protein BGS_0958 [Beggiatoa sp. SS]|nr:hypothetical protein BGS_0958 [Beggiatoa sp. SS]
MLFFMMYPQNELKFTENCYQGILIGCQNSVFSGGYYRNTLQKNAV